MKKWGKQGKGVKKNYKICLNHEVAAVTNSG